MKMRRVALWPLRDAISVRCETAASWGFSCCFCVDMGVLAAFSCRWRDGQQPFRLYLPGIEEDSRPRSPKQVRRGDGRTMTGGCEGLGSGHGGGG